MAVKISDLPIITTVTDDDYFPMVDPTTGQTRRVLKSDLLKELRLGTDLGIGAVKADKANFSVADATARLALASPFEGLTCYQKDVDAYYIYDGVVWRRQAMWEELGRTTLGTAGDTITVSSLAARKFIQLKVNLYPSGATDNMLRFNNDSGANYAWEYISQGTRNNVVSSGSIPLDDSTSTFYESFEINIDNSSSQQKLVWASGVFTTGTAASSAVGNFTCAGKWASNTQISRVDVINGGAGDFAIGSQVIVLGRD